MQISFQFDEFLFDKIPKIRESLFTLLSSADISFQFDDFFEENSKILSRIWDFQKWLENVQKQFICHSNFC